MSWVMLLCRCMYVGAHLHSVVTSCLSMGSLVFKLFLCLAWFPVGVEGSSVVSLVHSIPPSMLWLQSTYTYAHTYSWCGGSSVVSLVHSIPTSMLWLQSTYTYAHTYSWCCLSWPGWWGSHSWHVCWQPVLHTCHSVGCWVPILVLPIWSLLSWCWRVR